MTLQGLILRELSEGVPEEHLAHAVGVTGKTLREILNGQVPDDLAVWKQFAAYFRMDVGFLRFGELMSTACACQLLPAQPKNEVVGYRKVPLRSWSQLAQGDQSEDENPSLIETDVAGDDVFAVRVQDDSMQPLFHPGEILFVRPEAQWEADQYVVAKVIQATGPEAVLRQMKIVGDQNVLHPLNRKYLDRPLRTGDVILGRVTRLRLNL